MLTSQETLQNPLLLNDRLIVKTSSVEETIDSGHRFSEQLALKRPCLVFLFGDLGCGKTYFTKGIARGFGIDEDYVCSPTFILMREHHNESVDLFHCDLYRIKDSIEEIHYLDLFNDLTEKAVFVIEWPPEINRNNLDGLKEMFSSFFSVKIDRPHLSYRAEDYSRSLSFERIF